MWLLLACTMSPDPTVEPPSEGRGVDTAADEVGDTAETAEPPDTEETATPVERVLIDDGVAYVAADDVHADFAGDKQRDALIEVDDGVWVVAPVPADTVGLLASAVATITLPDGGQAATGDVDGDTFADVVLSRINGGDPV